MDNMDLNIKPERLDAYIIENYEEELKGITTFLHEEIAQKLYAVFNNLQYLQKRVVDNSDSSTIDDMVKLTKRTIEDIRIRSNETHPFFHNGIDGALKAYLSSVSKKHGLAIQYKEVGDKQQMPLLSEIIVFRTVKDFFSLLSFHSYPKNINVISFWGDSLHIRMEFIWEDFINCQPTDNMIDILAIEKKLRVVDGQFSLIKTSSSKIEAKILIPNVR